MLKTSFQRKLNSIYSEYHKTIIPSLFLMPPYVNFFYLSYMTEKYWKVGAEKFKIKPTKPQACPSNVILACALVLMGFLPKLGLQNGI